MLNNSKLQTFLAIGPIILFILFFIAYFIFIFTVIQTAEQNPTSVESPMQIFAGMGVFLFLMVLMILLGLASWVYFLIHAAKNPNLEGPSNMRLVWILVIALISGLGQLIYWIVEIKSKNPKPYIPN